MNAMIVTCVTYNVNTLNFCFKHFYFNTCETDLTRTNYFGHVDLTFCYVVIHVLHFLFQETTVNKTTVHIYCICMPHTFMIFKHATLQNFQQILL